MSVKGRWTAYWFVLLMVLMGGRVAAQESPTITPQPDQNYISQWGSEVIYPQALHFTIALSRVGAEIASARLTITQETGAPVVIEISPQDAMTVRAPYSELAYTYSFPPDAPPPLFSTVRYRWEIQTTQREFARIDDLLVMQDGRVTWVVDEAVNPAFTLTLPDVNADTQAILAKLRRTLSPVYDRLAADLGTSPTLRMVIYPDDLSQSIPPGCVRTEKGDLVAKGLRTSIELPCDLQMADQVLRTSERSVVRVAEITSASMQTAITNRLVDSFYQPLWAGQSVPAWFLKGIQSLYSPVTPRDSYGVLAAAARTSSLFSLDSMTQLPADIETDLWQAQSAGMVLYIAAQSGVESVIQLARALPNAGSFEAAYQSVTGHALSAILPDLRRWLFTDSAPAAFGLNLYVAATATPTATRTPTPTATFTPSATPSATPTATVTGVLTFTPMPSFTPTLTRTPAPATITPRPPGSLNPTPSPTASAPLARSPLLLILGAALLVAILAVLVSLFQHRRR